MAHRQRAERLPGHGGRWAGPSTRSAPHRIWRAVGIAGLLGALLVGCTIPTDPDGTLDDVRAHQVLRAGASPAEGWVVIGADATVSGREPELVVALAAHLGARVEWTVGGEEELVKALEHDRLDLVVGGLTSQTPWQHKVALTRPYAEQTDQFGRVTKQVIFVQLGENAFLSELEVFLDERGGHG